MGNGDVGMHISEYSEEYKNIMMAFKDSDDIKPINVTYDITDFYDSFEDINPPVILTFSNPDSIDSMIAQLNDMKKLLIIGLNEKQ